jgi:hypothetical protein
MADFEIRMTADYGHLNSCAEYDGVRIWGYGQWEDLGRLHFTEGIDSSLQLA